jgi:hypothetical protein
MKYLKKFNESFDVFKSIEDDIRDISLELIDYNNKYVVEVMKGMDKISNYLDDTSDVECDDILVEVSCKRYDDEFQSHSYHKLPYCDELEEFLNRLVGYMKGKNYELGRINCIASQMLYDRYGNDYSASSEEFDLKELEEVTNLLNNKKKGFSVISIMILFKK